MPFGKMSLNCRPKKQRVIGYSPEESWMHGVGGVGVGRSPLRGVTQAGPEATLWSWDLLSNHLNLKTTESHSTPTESDSAREVGGNLCF